jgi:hypothetical protein
MELHLIGADGTPGSWRAAARRAGFRLVETVNGEGATVTAVMLTSAADLGRLRSVVEAGGAWGAIVPLA